MALQKGVYIAAKKDGTIYYRSSITYKNKHISLGSFNTEYEAHKCYIKAAELLSGTSIIADYPNDCPLGFEKWVSLINFRDNGIYFKNPIYLHSKFFSYHYSPDLEYKFDVDDLFFYSKHKIMKRGSHLFVAEYGMQTNILSRYGIKSYSTAGEDYVFINDDPTDFRYKNIKIINRYHGVSKSLLNGRDFFTSKIHIKHKKYNGDYIIGKYYDETDAAIAYNKAADLLNEKGIISERRTNYLENLTPIEYAKRYNAVKISPKIRKML